MSEIRQIHLRSQLSEVPFHISPAIKNGEWKVGFCSLAYKTLNEDTSNLPVLITSSLSSQLVPSYPSRNLKAEETPLGQVLLVRKKQNYQNLQTNQAFTWVTVTKATEISTLTLRDPFTLAPIDNNIIKCSILLSIKRVK